MGDIHRLAVITGASRGIGSAIAKELSQRGYDLIINSRDAESIGKRSQELSMAGGSCVAVPGDIGDPATSDRIFEEAARLLGEDTELILINNAAISHIGLLQDMRDEDIKRIMDIDLCSVLFTCRRAVPLMLRQKRGHIVNISSAWGQVGASMEAAYSAAKGGVDAFTRALAKELAPSGIAVNALSLGVMDTSMNACFSREERQELEEEIPAGRFGRPSEAAGLCAYLCECDTYLTGQIIRLDGGWI